VLIFLNVALQAVESKRVVAQTVHQLKKKFAAARQSPLEADPQAPRFAQADLTAEEEQVLRACDSVGTVAKDTVVYHGSPAVEFKWALGVNPFPMMPHNKMPDAPAWFAFTAPFSIHAGLRFLVGQKNTLYLHQYKLKQQIAVYSCRDHAELLHDSGLAAAADTVLAAAFCKKYADQYNGYIIQRDAVRAEPELILCSTAVLTYVDKSDWLVAPVVRAMADWTGAINGKTACFLKNNALAQFECVNG